MKVGSVVDRRLDPETFEAIIGFTVNDDVQLPDDTAAVVTSDNLFGGKYLRLLPGTSTGKLSAGGEITDARDFETLEDQVSKIIFLATGSDVSSSN